MKTRAALILTVLSLAVASCTTVRPDGTKVSVDQKAVKVITRSAIQVATDVARAYLRYIAPTPTQTLYDGPRVITSHVEAWPW